MRNPIAGQKAPMPRYASQDVTNVVMAVAAFLLVLAIGTIIAAALPEQSGRWMFGAAYLAPAGLAFAAYWWIAQRS